MRYLIILLLLVFPSASLAALAFPGAEGFGSATRGAYQKYEDSVLPEDFSAIIDTGGTITLTSNIELWPVPPYMTIAGQTAPGDGICIRNARVNFNGPTTDIIVRGLRFRTGVNVDSGNNASFAIRGNYYSASDLTDGVMVDHCSFSWSTGKLFGTNYNIDNVSFTNNLGVEPLQNCQNMCEDNVTECTVEDDPSSECDGDACVDTCPGGNHNYGWAIGGGSEYVTVSKNVIAHSRYRNPLFGPGGGATGSTGLTGASYGEGVNNIVYNDSWASFNAGGNSLSPGVFAATFIAGIHNYHKAGSDTFTEGMEDYQFVLQDSHDGNDPPGVYLHEDARVYLLGNLSYLRTSQTEDEDAVLKDANSQPGPDVLVDAWPFIKSNVTYEEASVNYTNLITNGMIENGDIDIPKVGAYPRDAVDAAAIADIIASTGEWIEHEDEGSAGGFPVYATGSVLEDIDQDGMPATWEVAKGLDDTDATDAHDDRDSDGYTNIEEYINSFFEATSEEVEISSRGVSFRGVSF